ncbi:hypothetical protein ACFL1B_03360 [Nanoarchaeota archaeon]
MVQRGLNRSLIGAALLVMPLQACEPVENVGSRINSATSSIVESVKGVFKPEYDSIEYDVDLDLPEPRPLSEMGFVPNAAALKCSERVYGFPRLKNLYSHMRELAVNRVTHESQYTIIAEADAVMYMAQKLFDECKFPKDHVYAYRFGETAITDLVMLLDDKPVENAEAPISR